MAKKIMKLKFGPVQIEFEGDELPTRAQLYEMASAAADVYKEKELAAYETAANVQAGATKLRVQGTTASIASRLNCVSGPELIIAAAARITFVEGEEWFEPEQLLREMQSAAAHFEGSYRPALQTDIEELVNSGKLVEVAPMLYALSATMRRELQRALAE